MRKLLLFSILGASLASSIAACVSDDASPATPSAGATQGEAGGPCFADNTCRAGLTCGIVAGKAQCAAGDAGASSSGSVLGDSGTSSNADADAESDSGPTACTFTPSPFPCGGDNPPTSCFGSTQSCTLTGCGGADDVRWMCNSVKECNGAGTCCVAKANATLTAGNDCSPGTLKITPDTATGSVCGADLACPDGDTQLCQSSAGCPAGQQCKPVKITGAGASFNGQTLGACTP